MQKKTLIFLIIRKLVF